MSQLDVSRGFRVGTAYLEEVHSTPSGVEARLVYPRGDSCDVRFDCVVRDEDRQIPEELGTVFSVQIRSRAASFECTLLGPASDGPRKLSVTLERALGLAERGVHAVFSAERSR